MQFLFGTLDGIAGAVAQANHAAIALLWVNRVSYQSFADLCRAYSFVDMGFVFISEISDSREDRVRGSLSQTAQRTALYILGQLDQILHISRLTFTGAGSVSNVGFSFLNVTETV